MNDQQMLEFAAIAAGYKYSDLQFANETGLCILDGQHSFQWNPLEDDREAFCLAVDLRIDIINYCEVIHARVDDPIIHSTTVRVLELRGTDSRAAIRRAILRVAAEIGKNKYHVNV